MSRYFEDEWPHRPKAPRWNDLNKEARLARVMFPSLCEPSLRRDMAELARADGKTDPLTAKQRADHARREQSRPKRR
jgi:hypothetical protein